MDRSGCLVLNGVLWKNSVSSAKKDGESGTKTQNRQGFVWCWGYWSWYDGKTAENAFRGFSHEYDEWRDYDNERNYFAFVHLEKMFFRAEGLLVAWPSGQKRHFFRWRKLGCRFKSWRGYLQFLFLFLSSYFYPSAFYCLFSLLTVSFARFLRKHMYLVLLKRNSINVHCKFGARQKWEPAGRMGDFGHFSTVSLKAHDCSSWILTEGNLSRKFVKYCILSEVSMIHGTVSPQMWCIKSIKGWFTRPQTCWQDFVK